jgi:hypothetical protein
MSCPRPFTRLPTSSGRACRDESWRADGRPSGRASERTGGRAGGRASGRAGERTGGRADGRASGRMGERTGGRADGWASGRTGERTDGRADVQTGGQVDRPKIHHHQLHRSPPWHQAIHCPSSPTTRSLCSAPWCAHPLIPSGTTTTGPTTQLGKAVPLNGRAWPQPPLGTLFLSQRRRRPGQLIGGAAAHQGWRGPWVVCVGVDEWSR